MTKVYKFPLDIADEQVVLMPKGSKVLTVQVQKGKLYLWAECNPNEPNMDERSILIRGTGHPINDEIEKEYIGTIQMCDGSLVFHVFEKL